MWFLLRSALLAPILILGACTHITSNTNQFYKAQTYLALPVIDPGKPTDDHPARCVAGPVVYTPLDEPRRSSTKPLPGMALQVVETSYSATRDDAAPSVSEWQWTIPTGSNQKLCSRDGSSVPFWSRSDILKVRHLLSRAQHPQNHPANTEYFRQAVEEACKNGTLPTCLEDNFLNKFVDGLQVNFRDQNHPASASGHEKAVYNPDPLPEVLANVGAPDEKSETGLAQWYSKLTAFRTADLFGSDGQAAACSVAFTDADADAEKRKTSKRSGNEKSKASEPRVDPQDAEVCRFALASLEWRKEVYGPKLPGATLEQYEKLWLLRTGDPILLMQPTAYENPLDASKSPICEDGCKLSSRVTQGFLNFNLLIPISISGRQEFIEVGTSIADFEKRKGVAVEQIHRSVDWLPAKIAVSKGDPVPIQELADATGRVSIRFAFGKTGLSYIVVVKDDSGTPAKEDFLFAPGDVVVVSKAR